MTKREPLRLTVTLTGPMADEHRLPLAELLRVGKQLRDSLRDVAIVLSHGGPSGKMGRARKLIEKSADLRVVAAPRPGSFVLELETPPQTPAEQEELPADMGPALSERSVVAFVEGLGVLSDESEQLPHGFDRGVLRAVVPFRTTLRRGVTEIALSTSRNGKPHTASITAPTVDVAERLIKKPIRAEATAEGVLQMVDFGSLEFRVDRPDRPSVSVYFNERDRDRVHGAVRQYVRVAGEGQYEPDSDEPSKLWASQVDVLYEEPELDPRAFWREPAIEDLAREQKVDAYSVPEDLDSDPWRDDEQAAALIEAIRAAD